MATSVETLPVSKRRSARSRAPCVHVAVHRDRLDVVPRELLAEPVGAALGAHEDEREAALLAEQLDERLDLVSAVTDTKLVLDLAVALLVGQLGLEAGRVVVYARASSPTSPSSVAEKNIVWRSRGSRAQDAVDLGLEAHVEHPVGLVEDEDASRRRATRACARPGPAAGRAWRRARARRARAFACAAMRDAAVDGGDREAAGRRDRLELGRHLDGELARRHEHRARPGAGVGRVERSTIGIAKASVLPEPVGDLASTSRPASASGTTSAWMGKGAWMSRSRERLRDARATPSASEGLHYRIRLLFVVVEIRLPRVPCRYGRRRSQISRGGTMPSVRPG